MEDEDAKNDTSPPQLDIENEGSLFDRRDFRNVNDDVSGMNSGRSLHEPLLLKNRKNTTSQIAIVGANVSPIESLDYEYVFLTRCNFVRGLCCELV